MSLYFVSPDGTSVMRCEGVLPPPEDWTEITAEEFHQRLADHGQDYENEPVRLLSDVLAEQGGGGEESPAPAKMTAKSRAKAK
jgi:hypothetical protein